MPSLGVHTESGSRRDASPVERLGHDETRVSNSDKSCSVSRRRAVCAFGLKALEATRRVAEHLVVSPSAKKYARWLRLEREARRGAVVHRARMEGRECQYAAEAGG